MTNVQIYPCFSCRSIAAGFFDLHIRPVLLLAACADSQVRQAASIETFKCAPTSADAFNNLGYAYRNLGNFELAFGKKWASLIT